MKSVFIRFKALAKSREVDTTNSKGYDGYKGVEYSLGKFKFMALQQHFRTSQPEPLFKYLYGTTRISRDEFIRLLKTNQKEFKESA